MSHTRPNNISLKGVYKCIESFQYQDDMGEGKKERKRVHLP